MDTNQSLVSQMLSATEKRSILWTQLNIQNELFLQMRNSSREYYSMKHPSASLKIQEWNINSGNIFFTRNKNFHFYVFKVDIIFKFWNSDIDLYDYTNSSCIFLFSIDSNNKIPYPLGSNLDDEEILTLFTSAYSNHLKSNAPNFKDLKW